MGFSVETFFADLIALMDSEMKAAKKLRRLAKLISDARAYAAECGHIKEAGDAK